MRDGEQTSSGGNNLVVPSQDNDDIVLDESVSITEDRVEPDVMEEETLIMLEEDIPDYEGELLLLEDDLEETEEEEEDSQEIIFLDENLQDFIVDNAPAVFEFDPSDDDVVLDEEGDVRTSYREGQDIPPQESLESFIEFSKKNIEVLEKSIDSNIMYNDNSSRELLSTIMNSKDMPFLTSADKASLLSLVEGTDSEEQIIKIFLTGRRFDKKNLLELTSYVRQIMARYKSYLQKTEVLANIKGSINKFIVGQFIEEPTESLAVLETFVDSEKVCYVSWVKTSKGIHTYGCGNCSETNESSSGFFKTLVSERTFFAPITLFPIAQVCSHCGNLNLLTYAEYQSISAQLNSKYEEIITDWRKSPNKLAGFGNMIAYQFSKEVLPSIKSDLFIKEQVVEKVQDDRLQFSKHVMDKWYLETVEALKLLQSKIVDNKGGLFVEQGRLSFDKKHHSESIKQVTRLACNMFREDYSALRNSALSSLLSYLRDNPVLMNSLDPDILHRKEALLMYKGYLDNELPESDVDKIYDLVCKDLGMEPGETREETETLIREELSELEESYKQDKENFEKALKSLPDLVTLYRFVTIKQISNHETDDFSSIFTNKDLVRWADLVCDLMITNKLSDQILDYWKTLSIPKYKHKSVVSSQRVSKTFKELVTELIDNYTSYFDNKSKAAVSSPKALINDFLSTSYVDMSLLGHVYDMKNAIETVDYFTFCFAVVGLADKFDHESRAFADFRNFLSKHKESSQKFCEAIAESTTGNKLVDYYVYHYGDQFTVEEIIESSNEIHGYSKEGFYIEREEGETFGNYLKRLRSTKFDEKSCMYDKDLSKFRAMNGYIPALYGVFEFFHHIGNLKDNVKTNLLMNDLLYFSYFYGKKYMLEMLGFVNLPLVDNDNSMKRISNFDDPEKHRIEFILDNLVYPGLDFNVIVSGSDEETSSVLDVLKEDEDAFMEQLKYFDGFGEQIREYYSSGRE